MNISKIIVLILSYNGKHLLEDSISSYLANGYTNFEVVVIDNGSTDGTEEWVRKNYPNVFVLRTVKNLGYSGGFNFGLDYAFNKKNADYVLITNNDVKADTKVISELVNVAETDPMIGFVTGKVYYYDQPNIIQTEGFEIDSPTYWTFKHINNKVIDKKLSGLPEEREFSDDIFMLVKKVLFQEIGGYDNELLFQGEQFEWQIRAKKKGYKIFYTPEAKIWHKESMTIGKQSGFKTYYNIKNMLIIRLKHKDEIFIKKFLPLYSKNFVLKPLVKNLVKMKFIIAFKTLSGFLSAINWGIKNKKIKI